MYYNIMHDLAYICDAIVIVQIRNLLCNNYGRSSEGCLIYMQHIKSCQWIRESAVDVHILKTRTHIVSSTPPPAYTDTQIAYKI